MEEKKIYEAIEYLTNKNSIEGIPLVIFTKLLDLDKGEKYETRTLKDFLTNTGIVFGRRDNKNSKEQIELVRCVKYYYDIQCKDNICYDITEQIGLDYSTINNCSDCHKKCLELIKNKKLKRNQEVLKNE